MLRRTFKYAKRDRLRAVFLCVSVVSVVATLSACVGGRESPWVATFASTLPGGVKSQDLSKQAAAIPYASVDLSVGGPGGLLILAEQADGLTFWQSSSRETIVFRGGYLNSTRGLQRNLLSNRLTSGGEDIQPWGLAADQPVIYRVERSWENTGGQPQAGRAQATFACNDELESVELPLTTLDLSRCTETLEWDSGKTTRSVLWRHPDTNRIWAGDAVAWPGGPQVTWQVARPWW